ncbi:hypothetical protein PA598K_01788 [Paenibacillus sp. 598K]|uniref:efflux RND transporter periplasmic adaptor subunit n=1 Tax=Paenibacillus sp. 598K TaxID=1117987 RepID=UPI000FF9438D|nr:HlyD family efflux transporter periplasmic adaptor subunit [Paenibacillus sp. 598K]GBF73495.1 hypothetical protein PA598K_01788 [Paenibacillus sp. 598K]
MNGRKAVHQRIKLWAGMIVLLLIAAYFAIQANQPVQESLPMREYEVLKGDITAGITANGYLSMPSVSHYYDAPAQIEELYVKKGDAVKAGDKLAKAVDHGLADPYLYAKLDGIVVSVPLAAGEMTSGKPIVAQIGDPEGMFAHIQISQADIADVEVGQQVSFTLSAYPSQELQGTITQVLLAPTKASPLEYAAYAVLEPDDNLLLLEGMTFSAQLIQKQAKDVLRLSNKAIQLKEGKQIVMLKDEKGKWFEQEIQTGFSDGRYSEILSGLSVGDVVYVEGEA